MRRAPAGPGHGPGPGPEAAGAARPTTAPGSGLTPEALTTGRDGLTAETAPHTGTEATATPRPTTGPGAEHATRTRPGAGPTSQTRTTDRDRLTAEATSHTGTEATATPRPTTGPGAEHATRTRPGAGPTSQTRTTDRDRLTAETAPHTGTEATATPRPTTGPGAEHATRTRPGAGPTSQTRTTDRDRLTAEATSHTGTEFAAASPSTVAPAAPDVPEVPEVPTHCPYCALQCGTRLAPRDGGAAGVRPSPDFPVNQGGLCQKGWTAPTVLTTPDRLTTPLVRDAAGTLVPTGWDTALDLVAERLRALRDAYGPDAVGVFGGGGLTNEKAYLLGKFARVALGTSQIDYNGRFCMSSAATAGNAAFGVDRGLPFPVTDLGDADVILLAGANPADTMPPLMRHLGRAALVVIDPRRTATAERAALHLQPAPGTDLALALGLLHLAVVEGLVDTAYVAARTAGFDAARQRAMAWWPERVERVTGVPVAELREAVALLAGAGRAYVLTGRGAEQHSKGTDTAAAFVNLALALGLPGRPGSGYGCLTGQGNGQGGREHGQKADQLPGYRMITDPAAREHVAGVWGVPADSLPGPGRGAYELLDALGTPDGPKALLVFGSNPAVSAPRAGHVSERLAALDLLVVADFVPSETARTADVVLPVTQWAEEEGTMTNLEGRVLRRRRALPPPTGVRTDLEVLQGLAVRLGQPADRFPSAPRTVFEELRRASRGGRADYAGISYDRLDAGEALHWPCPAEEHPGTPRLFLDRFAHPDGRARFAAVEHRDAAESPGGRFPLYATTGRSPAHYQSGAQTRRVPELTAAAPEAYVEIHPDTARRAGLDEGALARISSARGSTLARVRLVGTLRTDTVFLPFHFPAEGRANLLTSDALDPRSGMPEFKVCAVRVEPCGTP